MRFLRAVRTPMDMISGFCLSRTSQHPTPLMMGRGSTRSTRVSPRPVQSVSMLVRTVQGPCRSIDHSQSASLRNFSLSTSRGRRSPRCRPLPWALGFATFGWRQRHCRAQVYVSAAHIPVSLPIAPCEFNSLCVHLRPARCACTCSAIAGASSHYQECPRSRRE